MFQFYALVVLIWSAKCYIPKNLSRHINHFKCKSYVSLNSVNVDIHLSPASKQFVILATNPISNILSNILIDLFCKKKKFNEFCVPD